MCKKDVAQTFSGMAPPRCAKVSQIMSSHLAGTAPDGRSKIRKDGWAAVPAEYT